MKEDKEKNEKDRLEKERIEKARIERQKTEIRNQTNMINEQINDLAKRRTKYQNMNKKLHEMLSELKTAKGYIDSAYSELKRDYSSQAAKKKNGEFEKVSTEINEMIQQINKKILVESNKQIELIDENIRTKGNNINQLNNLLRTM